MKVGSKKYLFLGSGLGAVFILVWCALPVFFLLKGKEVITPETRKRLVNEGVSSISSLDVPVGALLIYKGTVIGSGHNTVNRNLNLGQHAEINAISEAFFHLGNDAFQKLNRDSLTLVTSFEPCLMCRGAILDNNIKHVEFVKKKGWEDVYQHHKKEILYHLRRKQLESGLLQDSLFELHPRYKKPQ